MNKKGLLIGLFLFVFSFLFISDVRANEFYDLQDSPDFIFTYQNIEDLKKKAKKSLTNAGLNADDYNYFVFTYYKKATSSKGYRAGIMLFNDNDIENNKLSFEIKNNRIYVKYKFDLGGHNGYAYASNNVENVDNIFSLYFYVNQPNLTANGSSTVNNTNDIGDNPFYILDNFDLKNWNGQLIYSKNYDEVYYKSLSLLDILSTIVKLLFVSVGFVFEIVMYYPLLLIPVGIILSFCIIRFFKFVF